MGVIPALPRRGHQLIIAFHLPLLVFMERADLIGVPSETEAATKE